MRPTVLSNANASASAGVGGNNNNSNTATNGITIPIRHEYGSGTGGGHSQPNAYYADPNVAAYGSPRQQPQPQQSPQQHQQGSQTGSVPQQQHPHQQIPRHFQQGFGFEPDMDMDMDMDMFPRSRLGRMHDPFGSFNNSPDFGFPQFNSLGRRRAADHMGRDDDFFNRLPSEFRQYIPEGFGHRRGDSATLPRQHGAQPQQQQPQQQVPVQQGNQGPSNYYQSYVPASPPNGVPQSPSKKLCDAAIQTEDPTLVRAGGDQLDSGSTTLQQPHGDNLKQHGLRNTMDMGVKSALESEHGMRAHSAPPQEQQQQQQGSINGKRQTPPPQQQQQQFGTQTTSPNLHKAYYAPQQQPHPHQRQQTSPPPAGAGGASAGPQTPGGTYIRTIPIFVEGRSEPIINSHKEIPNQNSAPNTGARAQQHKQQYHQQPQGQQQQQQQHRPTPINTQQQQQPQPQGGGSQSGVPPQTPHTLDSISKIQDIQRDVLNLMGHVEKFTGTRQDKEYAYLDEMLTRNLLKLDTIDTNGKDSIRLARKEAIKCIQASINVLEAKANENTKAAEGKTAATEAQPAQSATSTESTSAEQNVAQPRKSSSKEKVEVGGEQASTVGETEPIDVKQMQSAAIPLPPPEGMQVNKSASSSSAVSESKSASEGAVGVTPADGAATVVSSKTELESNK